MKTEQAIAEIIKAKYKEWLDTTGVIPEGTTYYAECLSVGDDCAEIIIDTVYDVVIKQAQIEVLNRLKKRSYCDNDFMDGKWHRYVFVEDIDKLIEEVQEQ